jgi:hypothetical protein
LVSDIKGRTYAKVFENRLLRRIFGLKKKEITGRWRKWDNKGFISCILCQI